MRIVFLVLTLTLVAAIHSPAFAITSQESAKASDDGIPAKLVPEVEAAAALGLEMYWRDQAAWHTTDFLRDRGALEDKRLRGWVTENLDDRIAVHWIGEQDGNYILPHRVEFSDGKVNKQSFTSFDEGQALEPSILAAFKARQTAINSGAWICSQTANTIVIPALYEDSARSEIVEQFVVFMLTSTTVGWRIVLGGHHRFFIDAKGENILHQKALTKSCINIDYKPETLAFNVTHLTSETPMAHHVFLSITHGMPIYVATTMNGLIWEVSGENIRVIGTANTPAD